MPPTLVFCGPTISHAEARNRLDAIYLPPAVQGSFVSAVLQYDPSMIILIDGGFQTEPAVKHKEILWVLSRGVTVVGASSMGALRAAELAPFMIGAGFIYRWYRRFSLLADDAVAVQHGPPELNFVPLTDALIDLRLTFRAAWRNRKISIEMAQKLNSSALTLNFRDRTLARVIGHAFPNMTNAELQEHEAVLQNCYVRQKYVDALQALELARSGQFKKPSPSFEFTMTRAFANDLVDHGIDLQQFLSISHPEEFT